MPSLTDFSFSPGSNCPRQGREGNCENAFIQNIFTIQSTLHPSINLLLNELGIPSFVSGFDRFSDHSIRTDIVRTLNYLEKNKLPDGIKSVLDDPQRFRNKNCTVDIAGDIELSSNKIAGF